MNNTSINFNSSDGMKEPVSRENENAVQPSIIIKEENWAVSSERIQTFFDAQEDVQKTEDGYQYISCQITLEPITTIVMGKWPMQRTKIRFEGLEEDLNVIYKRFFLQFLSAGG